MTNDRISIYGLGTWLEDSGLEASLIGGNFSKLLIWQFAYYKLFYPEFEIDWENAFIDRSRLNLIAQGLKSGLINYPLLVCTPPEIQADDENLTEAQYLYHHLFAPMTNGLGSIFGNPIKSLTKLDTQLYSQFDQEACLANCIPVSLEDFDPAKCQGDPEAEMMRIAKSKGPAPKVVPKKVDLIFTDCRLDACRSSEVLNKNGQLVKFDGSFKSIITEQLNTLTLAQAIALFSQIYYVDRILPKNYVWEWMMALVYNPAAPGKNQISVAGINFDGSINFSSAPPMTVGRGINFRQAF